MVCAPVRPIIPSLKLGDYLSVQAHKPCSISHIKMDLSYNFYFQVHILIKRTANWKSLEIHQNDFGCYLLYHALFLLIRSTFSTMYFVCDITVFPLNNYMYVRAVRRFK